MQNKHIKDVFTLSFIQRIHVYKLKAIPNDIICSIFQGILTTIKFSSYLYIGSFDHSGRYYGVLRNVEQLFNCMYIVVAFFYGADKRATYTVKLAAVFFSVTIY